MYLPDHTWPELGDYFADESLALVPVGSTEQHGPHLPESTDALIGESLAREAAERTGYLCTPTISVGVSPHHRQYHGTMWVDPPAFRQYVESLTRNLAYHGVDRVVYVNAHGGNVVHLREVARRLREDETMYALDWMWDESIPELVDDLFEHNGPHGGPKETAMVMHLAPDLVREDRLAEARDRGVVEQSRESVRTHGAATIFDTVENTESGVLGDQTEATPGDGERLFEAATDQLCALADWLADQPFEDLLPEPHV